MPVHVIDTLPVDKWQALALVADAAPIIGGRDVAMGNDSVSFRTTTSARAFARQFSVKAEEQRDAGISTRVTIESEMRHKRFNLGSGDVLARRLLEEVKRHV